MNVSATPAIDEAAPGRQKRRVLRLVGGGFDAAVRPHASWLHSLALRLTRSPADAADLVQDTLERALGAFDRLRPDTNHRAWLATILNNLFLDRCRGQARAGGRVTLDDVAPTLSAAPTDAAPSWRELGEADVRAAVHELPAEFREVFELHLDGLGYQAIADALGIPRPTVGTRLLRARKRVRELLQARLQETGHA